MRLEKLQLMTNIYHFLTNKTIIRMLIYIFIQIQKHGKDITKFNLGESEILYKRGSIFFVENVVKKDGKYYILWSDINE